MLLSWQAFMGCPSLVSGQRTVWRVPAGSQTSCQGTEICPSEDLRRQVCRGRLNSIRLTLPNFSTKLTSVYEKYGFEAKDIWNVDETGLITVQKPGHLVATKGERRVGSITSAERGCLVTMALACNAMGNIIPPHFVFPRKKYLPHFIRGGPEGSIGTANGTGWMKEDDFIAFLRHFVHQTRASVEQKVLLLLDNHSSRVHRSDQPLPG